jgi:hypothetical protein
MSPVFMTARYDGNSVDGTTQVRFGLENPPTRRWERRLDLYKFGRWKIGRKYGASEARNTSEEASHRVHHAERVVRVNIDNARLSGRA